MMRRSEEAKDNIEEQCPEAARYTLASVAEALPEIVPKKTNTLSQSVGDQAWAGLEGHRGTTKDSNDKDMSRTGPKDH